MAAMRKVAIFGNAGGGKSTLARRLAKITGLPLYIIDILQFPDGRYNAGKVNGGQLRNEEYQKLHDDLIEEDAWIIDGFENVTLAWKRFEAADTLIYVDLPVTSHYWGVTKRLAQGLFRNPRGWPANTPIWASSLDSYRVVWRCHTRLTPKYRKLIATARGKQVHHLQSRAQVRRFLEFAVREHSKGAYPEEAQKS